MDIYIKQKLEAIKKAKNDEEIVKILNKIYDDGFSDGANDQLED